MPNVHPSAIVDPTAEVAADVKVGPFCVIEGGTSIGSGTVLENNVTVMRHTTIGCNNQFMQGSIIGGAPQDRRYKGEPTGLTIGDDNVIREFVTLNRATSEGKSTKIGNRCYIMAFVHIGHDCQIMDDVTITNSVGVSGHVTIEERATVGGMCGVHQFVRIGKLAMVGGMSRIVRDVPPFMIVEGRDQDVYDINAVGLRRIGVSSEARMALHKACKLLFKSQLALRNAMEIVKEEVPQTDEVEYLLQFVERIYSGKNGRGDQK